MNKYTLHLCNCDVISDFDSYFSLLNQNDAIVFYADRMNFKLYDCIVNHPKICKQIYFVIDHNIHNLKIIDYNKWINLVNNFKRTYTWK